MSLKTFNDHQTIKHSSSIGNNKIHVMIIWEASAIEIQNQNTKSSVNNGSLNFMNTNKSSCSRLYFLKESDFGMDFISQPSLVNLGDVNNGSIYTDVVLRLFLNSNDFLLPSYWLISFAFI